LKIICACVTALRRREEEAEQAKSWEPARKVLLVKEKLEGADPVHVMVQDLQKNDRLDKCRDAIIRIVRGPRESVRASLSAEVARTKRRMTVAEQVG
jgi:hypothetical protein